METKRIRSDSLSGRPAAHIIWHDGSQNENRRSFRTGSETKDEKEHMVEGLSERKKKTAAGLWILSGTFGLLNAAGLWMYKVDRLPKGLGQHMQFWPLALFGAAAFFGIAFLLVKYGPTLVYGDRTNATQYFGLIAFSVILAAWLPWLISYYPMSADYDVYRPILQWLGQREKTNDFPWFYCSTVGWFYALGQQIGDKNIGMFLYIAVRAILMAAIYAQLTVRLLRRGARMWICWAVVLFYAVTPVWGAYAKHGFKDTQSAALFCWFIMETIEAVQTIREKRKGFGVYGRYSLAALAISLFRGNCIYIAVPITALLVIFVLKRAGENRIRISALLLSGVLVFGGYQVFIRKVEKVAPGGMASALTIPFQQTARTVRAHSGELTDEELAGINSVLAADNIGAKYDPLISDPVKDTAHDLSKNLRIYAGNWFRLGMKFPMTYLEALIGQTYGYYAFNGDQALHAGNWNCGMTIFNWVKDPRYDDSFTCDYIEGMQTARDGLDRWAEIWHGIPGLNLTDRKAMYTWIVILITCMLMQRRRWGELIPMTGMVLAILLCCGSPVNDCFRYFVPVAAAVPALGLLRERNKL